MKKTSLLLFLLFIMTTVFGQKKIENQLTSEHKNIKGTKVSLLIPDGFTEAPNFLGYQQEGSGSSIMVINIPGPYSEASKGITKEILLSQGVVSNKIKNYSFNGLPAVFVKGVQNVRGTTFSKYILAFGNEAETIMVLGASPNELKKIGDEIEKSILSTYYNSELAIDPFETLDWTIDVSNTKLKYASNMSTTLCYNVDGKSPTQSIDETSLLAGKSFSPMDIEDKKLYSLNRVKKILFEIDTIKFVNEITIDGIYGYEVLAEGWDKTGQSENIYQVILFSDNFYYILLGTTNDRNGNSTDELKKAIRTFRRK